MSSILSWDLFHAHTSVQFTQSCLTLCNPMDGSTPGYPVHCQVPCSNSCPSSWWCHSTMSSPVVPFCSCLQSFPASGSFPMNQFFTSGGQSIGVSASVISPSNEYSGLIDGLVGSPCSPRDSQESSPTRHSPTLTSIHDYWKNHSFD